MHHFDGGKMEYMSADVILAAIVAQRPHSGSFVPHTVPRGDAGWQEDRPGRELGSGLRLRESLGAVLEVLFCTMAFASLKHRFESSDDTIRAMAALRAMRRAHEKITHKALRGRTWDLAPSGAVGVVLRFGSVGSRNDAGQHEVVSLPHGSRGGTCGAHAARRSSASVLVAASCAFRWWTPSGRCG